MEILVIRHGESEADLLNVHEGRADFNLTERGHAQAGAMAEYVAKNYKVTKIYASTLKRAAQTAGHLSETTGVPIVFDENLMEFNNGLLAGLSYDEADRLYPEVHDLPIDQSVYGQESKVEFRARAQKALDRITSECSDDDTVAIVTHGGMLNQLYGVILQMPIGLPTFFATGDTGIHHWRFTPYAKIVIEANVTEHADSL